MRALSGLALLLLLFITLAGCAPGYTNATKAQGDKEMQEIINSQPDYYQMWATEAGR
jgi:ABC-type oligopeptide transport system substrate-binding subunit